MRDAHDESRPRPRTPRGFITRGEACAPGVRLLGVSPGAHGFGMVFARA